MSAATDSTLARLRPLPPRLRVAHLAALLRVERAASALSSPSPRERERAAGREDANEVSVRVGGITEGRPTLASAPLRPSRERASLASDRTASRGEGSTTPDRGPREGCR